MIHAGSQFFDNCPLIFPLVYAGERRRLREYAVPSVFPFSATPTSTAALRERRASRKRLRMDEMQNATKTVDELPMESCDYLIIDSLAVQNEETCVTAADDKCISDCHTRLTERAESTGCNQETQCNLSNRCVFTIDKFIDNDRIILYYTGFKTFEQFMLLFNVLGPCTNKLPVKTHLKPTDQLFMTLMKLRQASDDFEISLLFDLTEKEVAKIFICWINFLFFQLSKIDFWPSGKVVRETMSMQFQKLFPSTRVIIDATEIPIQKPSHTDNIDL